MTLSRFSSFSSCYSLLFLAQFQYFRRVTHIGLDEEHGTYLLNCALARIWPSVIKSVPVCNFSCLHLRVGKGVNHSQELLRIAGHDASEYPHPNLHFFLLIQIQPERIRLIRIFLIKLVRNSNVRKESKDKDKKPCL